MLQILGNSETVATPQWAIWDFFDLGASPSEPYGRPWRYGSAEHCELAELGEHRVQRRQLFGRDVYTPVTGSRNSGDGPPQGYVGLAVTNVIAGLSPPGRMQRGA
jgi:hypothetical protein